MESETVCWTFGVIRSLFTVITDFTQVVRVPKASVTHVLFAVVAHYKVIFGVLFVAARARLRQIHYGILACPALGTVGVVCSAKVAMVLEASHALEDAVLGQTLLLATVASVQLHRILAW